MQINYRKNYFKIYLWQAISILLGFASLFVVVPYLSSDKTLYGIYSVCTSLTIFFSYADLGFLSSGMKYAAEYYIKGDHKNEIRVIGFTAFIMIIVFLLFAIGILVFGIYPKILIPEIQEGSESFKIARCLLITLAISCPVIIGQRILGLIFTIRVEDYKYQRIMIIGNIVRILSVFYFFHGGQYRIVEYYGFFQLINLLIVIVGLLYCRKYGFYFSDFISSFKFDKLIFDKVKKLSGTSLIMIISMVLYFEIDQIVISHFIGIEAVAIYGAAFSVLTIVRTYCSLVYSPYTSRYNHYVGLGDYNGLSSFVNKMIIMFAPVIIIPILSVSLLAKPFVISWIGPEYENSAIIISLLVLNFITNFIKDPISCYFVATERNSYLLLFNILTPIIYWIGVFSLINLLELKAFALCKFIVPSLMAIGYYKVVKKDFLVKGYSFISSKKLWLTIGASIVITCSFTLIAYQCMSFSHTRSSLFINSIFIGGTIIFSLLLSVPFNNAIRNEIVPYLNKIWKR